MVVLLIHIVLTHTQYASEWYVEQAQLRPLR